MSDLVKRLKDLHLKHMMEICSNSFDEPNEYQETEESLAFYEAAALIEAQAERIKALEAGLDPFADAYLRKRIEYAKRYGADVEIGFKNFDKMPDKWKMEGITFSMGTFRHAASLLEAKP